MAATDGILGYSAFGSSRTATSGPSNLAEAVQLFVTDGAYRDRVVADPNAAAKAAGVDIGSAKVEMKYQEIKGNGQHAGGSQLLIVVSGAGVDWTGDVTLVLNR
jgi:hypothetical protein